MSSFASLIVWNTAIAGSLAGCVFLAQHQSWLKSRPGLTHFLWLIVLLKLVAPPVLSIPIPAVFASPSATGNAGTVGAFVLMGRGQAGDSLSSNEMPSRLWSWPAVLSMIALMGTVVVLVASFRRTQRITQLVRLAKNAPEWLEDLVDELAKEANVQRRVRAVTLDGHLSPFLWVSRRGPSVVIPSALVERLTSEELQLIVRHEIQHYVRRDHWTNLFSLLVGALLWWNPVSWWARRELRFAQELCCDASVLASNQRQRRRYAETLLQTVDFVASDVSTVPVPTTAFGSCSTFKRRIEMIGEKNLVGGMPNTARLILLPMAALLIAISPALAHDDDRSDTLADMQGEIRELRAAINDLQSTILKLATNDRERNTSDRREGWLTRERMLAMAEDARLNDEELVTLLRLGNSVDGNPRQFERLLTRDDLNNMQRQVLRKFVRDHDRGEEGEREDRERKIQRLSRETLHRLAEQADIGEGQRDVLFELAESVDFNAKQFERLSFSDDLNERQQSVMRKLSRVLAERQRDRRTEDRAERRIVRVNREYLNGLSNRAGLNESERDVLFQLAESVDFNARQFERLRLNDDLNRRQKQVLEKLLRDRESQPEHEDRDHGERSGQRR